MPRPLIGREALVVKSFRVEPTVWENATKLANQEGMGIAEIVRIALMQYLERNPLDPDKAALSLEERMALAYEHAEKAHQQGMPLAKGMCSICDYYL